METVTREQFVSDVKVALSDAESLLKQAASDVGPKAQELRDRAVAALATARSALLDAQDAISNKSREAARATDDWVHEYPWSAIGIAAGVGVLVGLIVSRR